MTVPYTSLVAIKQEVVITASAAYLSTPIKRIGVMAIDIAEIWSITGRFQQRIPTTTGWALESFLLCCVWCRRSSWQRHIHHTVIVQFLMDGLLLQGFLTAAIRCQSLSWKMALGISPLALSTLVIRLMWPWLREISWWFRRITASRIQIEIFMILKEKRV